MLGSGIIGFFILKNTGDESVSNFANSFGIAWVWISIFLIQMPFKLKNIEVDKNGLKVKSARNEELIPFKNIISVSKFDFTNPWMMTVKYLDAAKNECIKISYLPSPKHQRFMKEDEMTEYLTTQAKSQNPNFEESNS
ncbi:MAG: hypothetical protein AAGA62_02750 [Bacteroidota bacterium]